MHMLLTSSGAAVQYASLICLHPLIVHAPHTDKLFVCPSHSLSVAHARACRHDPPITANALLEIADVVVSSGLKDAGYVYFNIDAGWAHDGKFFGRNETTQRLQPNPRCVRTWHGERSSNAN